MRGLGLSPRFETCPATFMVGIVFRSIHEGDYVQKPNYQFEKRQKELEKKKKKAEKLQKKASAAGPSEPTETVPPPEKK